MSKVPASPLRRVAAWLLDYLLIAAYLILLTAASFALRASPLRAGFDGALSRPATAEVLGFLLLTLPVVLYFAIYEASPLEATLGKRALGLAVVRLDGCRLSIWRALLREAVRFLPWELSHALLWRVALSADRRGLPFWIAVGYGVVYALVLLYLATLFIGSRHRTVYDRLAGTIVITTDQPRIGPDDGHQHDQRVRR
jgi:RDD family.